MSLWDVVAGFSIARNINDPDSKAAKILKKINSATLNVLNGDKVDYVGGGGRTTNTFGAVTAINCDMEAVFEGCIAGVSDYKLYQGFLGLMFGPGAVNLMNIGNKTELQYMPNHSQNFIFRRGGKNLEFIYDSDKAAKTAITVLIVLFALAVFGFYLIYNFAGVFGIMKPVLDSGYIKAQEEKVHIKDKEIAELEASEAHQKEQQQQLQQQQTAAGYVPSPEEQKAQDEELEYTEKQLADAEAQRDNLEISLKKAERQKEWLIFGNVILENRGFWVIKTVEQFKGALVIATDLEREVTHVAKKGVNTGYMLRLGLEQGSFTGSIATSRNKSVADNSDVDGSDEGIEQPSRVDFMARMAGQLEDMKKRMRTDSYDNIRLKSVDSLLPDPD